jgi:hypothetical protein
MMGEKGKAYQSLTEKPFGKHLLLRQLRRYEDIKTNLRDIRDQVKEDHIGWACSTHKI